MRQNGAISSAICVIKMSRGGAYLGFSLVFGVVVNAYKKLNDNMIKYFQPILARDSLLG
jgi:hypothetical protein